MQRYFNTVTDRQGNVIVGASVAVTDANGAAATLYSDDGVTPTANPVVTDSRGFFGFYAANGVYSLTVSHSRIATYTVTGVQLEDLGGVDAADAIGFTQEATGAVERTVADKLSEGFITPEDFGAVGDGATDDQTALTNFINQLNANPSTPGYMQAKVYAISGSLPNITASGVRLYGVGPSSGHDVGTPAGSGTVIKRITNSGGTMLEVAPEEGVSNQRLEGIVVDGLSFNCNQLAAKGFVVKSVRYCHFAVYVEEATSTEVELGVVATLGENTSLQGCTGHFYIRHQIGTGTDPCFIAGGSATGNVSMNQFSTVDVTHRNGLAMRFDNADNNQWGLLRTYKIPAGTATNSVEWRGGANSNERARGERVGILSTSVAAIAKGTGTYTVGAGNIQIDYLDTDNSAPDPTVETGATCWWQDQNTPRYDASWSQTTPTPTAGAGSLTDVTSTLRVQRVPGGYMVKLLVTATNIGTGSSFIRVALPFTSSSGIGQYLIGKNNNTGVGVCGFVNQNSANIDLQTITTGAFPVANGQAFGVSGFVEAA